MQDLLIAVRVGGSGLLVLDGAIWLDVLDAGVAALLVSDGEAEREYRMGNWAAARAHAAEAGDRYVLLMLAAVTGDVESALGHAALVPDAHAHAGLGLMELGLDHPEAAIVHLAAIADEGNLDAQWRGDLVESQVRAGLDDDARASFARFTAHARSPSALVALARCRGLLAPDGAVFAQALPDDVPFERARSELCWGERLRRDGHRVEARRHLHDALRGFTELGATPWADKAARELRWSGGRAHRGPHAGSRELTAQEAQIASMVTEGRTNKSIASALFLSPRTVEFHLGRVFRKLGVSNRTQLARTWLND
jgi:DNA-binding CsgD family transcriptional regulator